MVRLAIMQSAHPVNNERLYVVLNDQQAAQYLLLIKKLVSKQIKDAAHYEYKDDIVNDVFLKLYSGDFFNTHTLDDKDSGSVAGAYIKRVVSSCYYDHLENAGIMVRATKRETEMTGKKTEQIKHDSIHGSDNDDDKLAVDVVSEYAGALTLMEAEEAYETIKECFNLAVEKVVDRAKFFFYHIAFWELDEYNMSLKDLAAHVGFANSNPTQDFNRFVEKVSGCTEKGHVVLRNPNEQIEILKQLLGLTEAE
jgi:hypothetical protein